MQFLGVMQGDKLLRSIVHAGTAACHVVLVRYIPLVALPVLNLMMPSPLHDSMAAVLRPPRIRSCDQGCDNRALRVVAPQPLVLSTSMSRVVPTPAWHCHAASAPDVYRCNSSYCPVPP